MAAFADRVLEAITRAKTPLCVGLDPRWEQIPIEIRAPFGGKTPYSLEAVAGAFEAFCKAVLEMSAEQVGVVKFQAAFFEQCGPAGFAALDRSLKLSRSLGLFTILDGKRNDIASTATAYAEASFGGAVFGGKAFPVWDTDAITVNPYLGTDGLEPFIEQARKVDGGVFVLVRTSNPGAGLFQDLLCPDEKLYRKVAQTVEKLTQANRSLRGWGDVGAVVGATYPAEIAELRELMPHTLFLIPGFGAQGAGAKELATAFRKDGSGALVNNGRAIIFAAKPDDPQWKDAMVHACKNAKKALAEVCHL